MSKNLLVARRQKFLGAKVVAAALQHQAVTTDMSKVTVKERFQTLKGTEMVLLVPTLWPLRVLHDRCSHEQSHGHRHG